MLPRVVLVALIYVAPFCGLLILLNKAITRRRFSLRAALLFVGYLAFVLAFYMQWGRTLAEYAKVR